MISSALTRPKKRDDVLDRSFSRRYVRSGDRRWSSRRSLEMISGDSSLCPTIVIRLRVRREEDRNEDEIWQHQQQEGIET